MQCVGHAAIDFHTNVATPPAGLAWLAAADHRLRRALKAVASKFPTAPTLA